METSASSSNGLWLAAIVSAIKASGGKANLPAIYRWIETHRAALPDEWQSVVRATIYAHSRDAAAYVKGNPDVFRKVSRGIWALCKPDATILGRSETALQAAVIMESNVDELRQAASDGATFAEFLKSRIDEKKRQFGMI